MREIRSSDPPVVTGIHDTNKYRPSIWNNSLENSEKEIESLNLN